jgi:putative photosynthetic complex assembly protein
MSDFRGETFPRGALLGGGGVLFFTMAMVFGTRAGLLPARPTAPEARTAAHVAVVATRELRFADRADGALLVYDTQTEAPALILAPGSNSGFIRGVMRGLMRERKLHEATREAPLTLTQWADGALTLRDEATGRIIELGSFGSTNRASFAQLLVSEVQRAERPAAGIAAKGGTA